MDVGALCKAIFSQSQDNFIILLGVLIWTFPFDDCVALGKLSTPRSLHFPSCKMGDIMLVHRAVVRLT